VLKIKPSSISISVGSSYGKISSALYLKNIILKKKENTRIKQPNYAKRMPMEVKKQYTHS